MSYQFTARPFRLKNACYHYPAGTIVARDDYGHWYIWSCPEFKEFGDPAFCPIAWGTRQKFFRDYWMHIDTENNKSPLIMAIMADTGYPG